MRFSVFGIVVGFKCNKRNCYGPLPLFYVCIYEAADHIRAAY